MTPLLDAPSTITTAQLSYLHRLARDHGMDTAALHEAAGVDSLKRLSVAGASALIARLGGGDLPAPGPGRRPPRKRRSPNVIAMITVGQVEQIERLGVHFFNGDRGQFDSW
ncbi:MAG: hypothetical protein KAV00_03865, partial [Phycisphaerae bacterium]|nr:hypothetical protein [Phycisphaerae bacterium]